MKKQVVLTCAMIWISFHCHSQYFHTGEDPGFLKWRQILTPNFQLIYPEEFEKQALKMAAYFEKVYEYGSATLHHQPRKISVIFHTRTVQSNGLVGWAPRRIELFTPPHQAIYAQDWLEQLVIHEFRHVVQVDKIHSQIPGIVKLLLGEQADALITGLYLPFWFIEGDAVVTETALSPYGRGRLPSFLMEHKAQVVEKGVWSFDKVVNGSFRDFVPDHYKLGYLLVGESRARYGSDLWSQVIDRLAQKPFSVRPVNQTLKKLTGMNQQELYGSVFDSLWQVWTAEDREFKREEFRMLTRPSDDYQSYQYNHFLKSGEIISLKSDYDQIPRFVRIDSLGHEKPFLIPGRIFDESVSYRNDLIVWSEYVPDIRWSHSGRSLIRIYNTVTKATTTVRPEYKSFAPVISPDEHNIAVVETDFGNNYYLSVYNAVSGRLVTRFATPENNYMFNPVWKNNKEVMVIILTGRGKQLAAVKPFSGEMEWLPLPDMTEIKQLAVAGEKLYFIGAMAGKDELYSIHQITGEIRREAKARFGLAYPSIHEKQDRLIVSDYLSNGYRLNVIDTAALSSDYICNVTYVNQILADSLARQEPGVVDFAKAEQFPYTSRPYLKGLNLFHFHSWGPFNLDVSSYEFMPGFSLSSQNKLGTAQTTLGYRWNMQEKEGQYYVNLEYRGLFPVFSAGISTGERKDKYYQITIIKDQFGNEIRRETKLVPFSWGQMDMSSSVRFPLILSRGRFNTMLQPSATYQLTQIRHNATTPDRFVEGSSHSMIWRTGFYHLMRQAYRDFQPRWGLVTDVSYRHSPFGGSDPATLSSVEWKGYFPGIFKHHGLTGYAGWQQRERGIYRTYNDVRMPVGYSVENLPGWWRDVEDDFIFTGSVKYSFPVGYPDWNLSGILYVRRWKAALFYDFGTIGGHDYNEDGSLKATYRENLNTLGLEFSGDINFLRFYAPVEAGIRMGYLPAKQKPVFEMILSVDFNSL